MFLRQALSQVHNFSPEQLSGLSDLLSPELIKQCLKESGVATIRKRRLPMEMMVWSVLGMSLYRHLSMDKVVSQLDILLPGKKPFCCPKRCHTSSSATRLRRYGNRIQSHSTTLAPQDSPSQLAWVNTPCCRWCCVENA